jgi:hypothetical protein
MWGEQVSIKLEQVSIKFETVDPDLSAAIRSRSTPGGGRPKAEWRKLVEAGEMVHLRDHPQRNMGGIYTALKLRGMRLRTTTDGEGGLYVWAEPLQ